MLRGQRDDFVADDRSRPCPAVGFSRCGVCCVGLRKRRGGTASGSVRISKNQGERSGPLC